jgi:lipid II:glycine glycyltransferase (peptidoglycan interpeptide bridge formation enzyme)
MDHLDPSEWNSLLSESEICDAFQSYEWAVVQRNSRGVHPHFLMVRQGDRVIGGLMFYQTNMLGLLDVYEARGGPLFVKGKGKIVIKNIMKAFRRKMKKSIYVLFVPSPLLNQGFREIFRSEGYHPIPFRTLILNLNRPLDDIWRALNKKARWGVRKAERMGVKVLIAETYNEWRKYYDLHVLHSRKKHYSTDPPEFFTEMFKLQSRNVARLFIAKYDGQIIAGSLFLIYGENMIFLNNASLDAFLSYNPNNLIQWASINWAKENGVVFYDLNGLPWEKTPYLRGIYEYKKRWDGDIYWYNYYLNNLFLCKGVHLIRSSFMAWKVFSRLRSFRIIPT